MPTIAHRTDMTVEEFLQWNLLQDERYELVDGVPVPLRPRTNGMAGTKDEHDTVVVNLIAALKEQLRGSGCRAKTADTAVRTKIKRIRRPDVTIECAKVELGSLEARNPIAVFEILSPTTRQLDRTVKLQEYMQHPTLRAIVHIDPNTMDVLVFTRGETARGATDWDNVRLQAADDVVRIAGLPVSLTLVAIYDEVPFPETKPGTGDSSSTS